MSKTRTFFFYSIIAMALTACGWNGHTQVGDVPPTVRVHAVKEGKHTKEDVTRLLGSPTSITLFEKESWLYIESKEQNRVFLQPKEVERRVVKITFAPNGTVSTVKELTLADGNNITPDSSITPVTGKDLSVFDELIGNFGRFPANKAGQR